MAKANSYTEMGDVYNGEFKNGQMTSEGKLIFKFKELSRYQNDTQNPKKDIQDDYLKALSISKNSLEWMEIFEKISKKISKYYSGSL